VKKRTLPIRKNARDARTKQRARAGDGVAVSRRARRVAETRERIYQAALGLFAERGFAATTVEDITDAADVGKGTFFNYFPSKEHVLGRFGESRVATVATALEQAREEKDAMRDVLRECVMRLTREPEKNPSLMRSILAANFASEPVRGLICRNFTQARELLAELLALGQERREVRRDYSAAELAQIFQHFFFGVQVACSLEPELSLGASFERSFAIAWAGLEARVQQPAERAKRR
jgi:AcrR family transcriptional regulator